MKIFEPITTPLQGSILIEANAGTGKTYTLALMYVRLILEQKLLPQQILVVTFTRAATHELKQRLRQKLEHLKSLLEQSGSAVDPIAADPIAIDPIDAALLNHIKDPNESLAHVKLALLSFDQCSIYTIHGFCEITLQKYQSQVNLPPMEALIADDAELRIDFIYRFWRQFAPQLDDWLIAYLMAQHIHPQPSQHNKLIASVQEVLSKPGFSEKTEADDVGMLGELVQDIQALKEYWQLHRATVFDDLSSRVFAANTVLGKDLQRCFSAVDAFIENGARTTDTSSLGAQKIRKALSKTSQDDVLLPFHADLDNLLQRLDEVPVTVARLCVVFVRQELQKRKKQRGLYAYDDQISYVSYMLQNNAQLAHQLGQQYQALLVDEFQDTDQRQYQIFQSIHQHAPQHPFVMVGDPKQSIYGFRGADVFAYKTAKQAVEQRYQLTTNWRSSPALIEFINGFYAQHAQHGFTPFDLPWIDHNPSLAADKNHAAINDSQLTGSVVYWEVEDDRYHQWLVSELHRLLSGQVMLGSKPTQAHDIAILVHSNKLAENYYELLLKHQLPAVLWSDKSIFSTSLAHAYYLLLEALQTGRVSRIKALFLSDLMGLSMRDLLTLDMQELSAVFMDYRQALEQQSLAEVLNQFYADFAVDQQLLTRLDGERLLTDREHLHELLVEKQQQGLNVEALTQWLAAVMERPNHNEEGHRRRLESDQRSISIITIHKAKGLEFPIVFLPELHQMQMHAARQNLVVPVYQSGEARLIWQPDTEDQALYWQQSVSELLRLLYVAMTRAGQRLYMVNKIAANRKGERKPKKQQVIAGRLQSIMSDTALSVWIDTAFIEGCTPDNATIKESITEIIQLNELHRSLATSLHVHSYSEIHKSQAQQHTIKKLVLPVDTEAEPKGIFAFPRGAIAGSCLHEIMEYIDISLPDSEQLLIIDKLLQRYAFEEKWSDMLLQHMQLLLNKPVIEDMTLATATGVLKEMDFLLPIDLIADSQIATWLTLDRGQPVEFAHQAYDGFMTGSIDLFLCHQGRYYIVDYKSNHLGDDPSAYDDESMHAEVMAHDYDLQYLLYTVAAVRHVSQIQSDFDYDRDFGGVLYLFIRGINHENANGIYFRKPDTTLVTDMLRCFQ
ncbi:exodeoxyribonuclease V subunit beta [Marinicella sp. W31]|uniref:exodeoxyribonuclease V subunit beta n=1 Tax=Marinicella sp. W31 TaxID=3023713 RepID=UPI0037580DAB